MNQNHKQLFKMVTYSMTQSLSLCGHSSIKLCNISTGKSAAAFRRYCFKLSILGCLFLQHPLPWTELELPTGLSPSTQGTDNPAVAEDTFSRLHLHFRLAFCKSRHKPLELQIVVQSFRRWLASRDIPILKV